MRVSSGSSRRAADSCVVPRPVYGSRSVRCGCPQPTGLLLAPPFLVDKAGVPPPSSGPPPGALPPLSTRSTASRGLYPPQLARKPREEESPLREEAAGGGAQPGVAGRRRSRGADASQGGGSALLRCIVSAAAASASTLLRIAACVRKRGQAATSRWRRRQRQHARCAKSGKMGAASPQAFQDGLPDDSEGARPAHRRYASEHAGGNVHREVPEQPIQYRCPPYWRNPAADAASNGDAYESSALVARAPYGRITSALEGSNEHIARHEEVRKICTDARCTSPHSSMCAAAGTGNHRQISGSGTSIKQWLMPRNYDYSKQP